jgi:allantoinase
MCEGPARLAGVARKGAIRAGGDADLVVFDPDAEWVVDARRLAHRHPVTPYAGARLTGQVVATYLRGEPVAAGGQITADRAGRVLRHRTTTAPA